MNNEHDGTSADTSATPDEVETGPVPVPGHVSSRSGLRGWRLVGSLAVLAGAGAAAWLWLFDAWPAGDAAPGARVSFTATAYCKGTTTAAGTAVRRGIAAADRAVLPSGSVVSLATGNPEFDGVYTVLDTGPAVQGRILDLYVWSCHEALAFGRRKVIATILRLGWDPRDSAPTMTDRLLHRTPRRHEPDPEDANTQAQPPKVQPLPTAAASDPVDDAADVPASVDDQAFESVPAVDAEDPPRP